jgi:hypothetical protein
MRLRYEVDNSLLPVIGVRPLRPAFSLLAKCKSNEVQKVISGGHRGQDVEDTS